MKAITVARKPLSGTVATTTLEHGCGALNIDACRVGSETRQSAQKDFSAVWGNKWGSGEHLPTTGSKEVSGRWPANLILQHLDGCRCDRVKKVVNRSGKASGPTKDALGDGVRHGTANGERGEVPFYGGNETVANWICVDGCPVKALDEQSGTLKSGAMDSVAKGGQYTTYGKMYERRVVSPASEGGASRFFKQVKP